MKRLSVVIPIIVFAFLLLRNPFSVRTLIPNLEPYPDSIHYLSPALNFVQGNGLFVSREGRALLPGVPPAYSLVLIPGFILKQDVRMFYITNVLLAFVSLGLFIAILRRMNLGHFAMFLILMLYVTNFTLSWFPTLAMAENLILPLALCSIYLLILPLTRKRAVLAGMIAVSFYATKFASLPLSVVVAALFTLKVLRSIKKDRFSILLPYFISLLSFGFSYVLYEFIVRKNNLIGGLFGLFWSLFAPKHIVEAATGNGGGGGFFSLQYIGSNLSKYIHWLMGNEITILWKNVSIFPPYIALLSWIGAISALFAKQKWTSFVMISMLVSNLIFMMTFYAADGRYFIIAIPIMLLNVGMLLSCIQMRLHGKRKMLIHAVVFAACIGCLLMGAKQVKFSVMLNLKYAETPWYYISIRTFNSYLSQHRSEYSSLPVIISALPPYLVDFYTSEKFILLPLSPGQEFRSHPKEAWGDYDVTQLTKVYRKLIDEGHPVFLTQYGLGNETYLHVAFDKVRADFKATEVGEGCFQLCNIYRLH